MKHLKDDIDLQKEINSLRKQLFSVRKKFPKELKKWSDLEYNETFYDFYHLIKPKQAEKLMEPFVANKLGGRKITKKDKQSNPEYKGDWGDITIGDKVILGKNNYELKASMDEKENKKVGGGQMRYYDNVAGYIFFQGRGPNNYDLFFITKDDLIKEERERIINGGGLTSSQGTGKWEKENSKEILEQNLKGERQDQVGFKFDGDKAQNYRYRNFEELNKKLNAI